VQTYSGLANPTPENPIKKVCPNRNGGNNYYPSSYSPKTQLLYVPAMTACEFVSIDRDKPKTDKNWIPRSGGSFHVEDRYESNLTALDPASLEIRKSVHLRGRK
jgi:alcohol dehydrogenase (cytochrome c)